MLVVLELRFCGLGISGSGLGVLCGDHLCREHYQLLLGEHAALLRHAHVVLELPLLVRQPLDPRLVRVLLLETRLG